MLVPKINLLFLVMLIGSICTHNLPKWKKVSPKNQAIPEDVTPYKPVEISIMDTSYIESKTLEEHGTCLFKGTFYDKKTNKEGTVMAPNSSFNVQ